MFILNEIPVFDKSAVTNRVQSFYKVRSYRLIAMF